MKRTTKLAKMSMPEKLFMAVAVVLASLFTSVAAFAQDAPQKVDVDINAGGDNVWYGQPWVWAVGVAIFIVIIVAITRSRSEK